MPALALIRAAGAGRRVVSTKQPTSHPCFHQAAARGCFVSVILVKGPGSPAARRGQHQQPSRVCPGFSSSTWKERERERGRVCLREARGLGDCFSPARRPLLIELVSKAGRGGEGGSGATRMGVEGEEKGTGWGCLGRSGPGSIRVMGCVLLMCCCPAPWLSTLPSTLSLLLSFFQQPAAPLAWLHHITSPSGGRSCPAPGSVPKSLPVASTCLLPIDLF